MTLPITPETMYEIIRCNDATLEEFIEWAATVNFEGYKEGFNDGSQSAQYEIEHGVLNKEKK